MAKKEKQKKKKGNSKIVSAIVAIVLIILILSASIFVIIDAIIDSIQSIIGAIITSIINLLTHPFEWIEQQWAAFTNWWNENVKDWNKGAPIGEFNEKQYENFRIDPTIVIDKDEFHNMKNTLDEIIDRKVAGLDNLMLKKMMLAYYRGLYLVDTTVLIELGHEDLGLTEEQFNDIKNIDTIIQLYAELEVLENELEEINQEIEELKNQYSNPGFMAILQALLGKINPNKQLKEMQIWYKKNEIAKYKLTFEQCNAIKEQLKPFSIIEGNELKGTGENGKTYWKTTGMVEIYVGETGENRIVYYKEDILDSIYNDHYLYMLGKNTEDSINYANSVLAYLNKCYTYTENGIKMYSTREYVTTEKTIEYVEESKDYNKYKDTNKEKEGNIVDWFWNKFSKEDKNEKTEGVVRQLTPTTVEPVTAQYLEFNSKVAQYATPMEFMIEMLEITASKDFINAFIEMVGEETYIKLRLYDIVNQEVQNTIEEKNRTTTVSGERSGTYTAQVVRKKNIGFLGGALSKWKDVSENGFSEKITSIIDGNTPCLYVTIAAQDEKKIEKDYKYEVKLYYNGKAVDLVEFEVSDDTDLAYIRFDEGIEPDETSKYAESKVIETTKVTTDTNKYDIAIAEVKTWYGTFTPTNIEDTTIVIKNLREVKLQQPQLTKPGMMIYDNYIETEVYKVIEEIPNAQELNALELMKKLEKAENLLTAVTYTLEKKETIEKAENEEIFENKDLEDVIWKEYDENKAEDTDGDYDLFGGYSENYCLNVLYNYVTQRGEGKGESSNYEYNTMTYVDSNRKKVSVILTYSETLKEGLDGGAVKVQTDYGPFLALLVEYDDLYGGKANVGKLLVNGEDILYTLLASNDRTDSLVQVMKAALYQYTNNNHTVENFEFDIFDPNNYVRVE